MKKGSRKVAELVLVLAAICLSGPADSAARNSDVNVSNPETLPAGLYSTLVTAIQSDVLPGYKVVRRDDADPGSALAATAYRAHNAEHGLVMGFGREGIGLRPRDAMARRSGEGGRNKTSDTRASFGHTQPSLERKRLVL